MFVFLFFTVLIHVLSNTKGLAEYTKCFYDNNDTKPVPFMDYAQTIGQILLQSNIQEVIYLKNGKNLISIESTNRSYNEMVVLSTELTKDIVSIWGHNINDSHEAKRWSHHSFWVFPYFKTRRGAMAKPAAMQSRWEREKIWCVCSRIVIGFTAHQFKIMSVLFLTWKTHLAEYNITLGFTSHNAKVPQ